jgi:hypothetical protein
VSLARDLRSDPMIRHEERVAEVMDEVTLQYNRPNGAEGPEEAAYRAVEQVTRRGV